MRPIDADELRKNVLKWMPSDPCGKEEKEFPFETDICASMVMEIDDAPTVEAPDINVGNIDAISRRQAIRWVKQECNPYGKPTLDFESGKRVMEHLEMMPSAQPYTTTHDSIPTKTGKNDGDRTSGDCISRQQAIDAICEHGTDLERRGITVLAVANHKQVTVDLLENLPSVQPERKTGRWIPCPQNASWLYVYKCSECGGYLQISDVDGKGYKANYCSYCGAKMKAGGKNDR